jgi:hypothetical protein
VTFASYFPLQRSAHLESPSTKLSSAASTHSPPSIQHGRLDGTRPKRKAKGPPKHLPIPEVARRYVLIDSRSAHTDHRTFVTELRNNIYHRCLDWNRVKGPMNTLKHSLEEFHIENSPSPTSRYRFNEAEHNILFKKRQAPTILLLCKEVTSEALSILHDVPLQFDFEPMRRSYEIMDFVTMDPFKQKREGNQPVFK